AAEEAAPPAAAATAEP
nr:PSI-E1=14.4 kda photosystem I psaE product {N-terminal} [Nicotiana sylvestris, leaves, Peptide Chloroplast Partial, 16 aa] [Nicotiana sylvestris]